MGWENKAGIKAQIYPHDSRVLSCFYTSILAYQLLFTCFSPHGCKVAAAVIITTMFQKGRKGIEEVRDGSRIPHIFLLPSHCPQLVHTPIPSSKEIGKVFLAWYLHCSPKQYQGFIHWKQEST